ncbi:MAG: hypothetical protein KGO49_02655 [Gammaproteobacteria bacterium]|nr:hypothetical protein [Gammaproteobacteria bacterium]
MNLKKNLIIATTVALSGCAGQYWANGESGSKTGAGVIHWDTNQSAALVIPNGSSPKACTQIALTTDNDTKKTQANVSNSILSVISKIPPTSTPGDLVAITSELTKVSQALNTSTERTTYLQFGGFYICQLQANGLENDKVGTLMTALIAASTLNK